jgi:hypothetical protein
MKTRIFAWLCLAMSLGLVCFVLLRRDVRSEAPVETAPNRPARDSGEDTGQVFRRIVNDADQASETICALARDGQMERAWKGCDALTPALLAECTPLVASIQAATDPLGAWQKVSSLADEKLRAVCQKTVLRSAPDGNFQELAGLAETLPDAADRETLLCEIVSRWALQDPAALSQWNALDDIPEAVRDVVARRLVHDGDVLNRSPEVAGAWAESIVDPGSRATAIESAAREWGAIDREAARAFVRRSPRLDAETKDSILTSLTEETPP